MSAKRSRAGSDSKTMKELSDQQGGRRRSTYFTNGSASYYGVDYIDQNNEQPSDYKEQFRKTILQMYAEDELAKMTSPVTKKTVLMRNNKQLSVSTKDLKCNNSEHHTYKMVDLIRYMATEHETLLQILIFLPLLVTALYITFVEERPLVT